MAFPATRLRRMRRTDVVRSLVRETSFGPQQLVQPLFVLHGTDRREPVQSMPGIERLSINHLVEEAGEIADSGVPAVLLFGVPSDKDEAGSSAYDEDGVVQMAVRAIKDAQPELIVITDVCLCAYTSHGHCGVLDDDGTVNNDITLELLAKTAVTHAQAGADMVAPSDMMDGRVGAIRSLLDQEGHSQTPIMAYSAKYASAFYGPFREAAQSSPEEGDRRAYQLDPANVREAILEAKLDEEEGADILMVKPAMPYLDVIRALHKESELPIAAYQVSGEYAMIKAAAESGWLDERAVALESLMAIRRAGAAILITYFAKEVARWP